MLRIGRIRQPLHPFKRSTLKALIRSAVELFHHAQGEFVLRRLAHVSDQLRFAAARNTCNHDHVVSALSFGVLFHRFVSFRQRQVVLRQGDLSQSPSGITAPCSWWRWLFHATSLFYGTV